MIHYEYQGRLRGGVVGWGLGGVLLGLGVGCLATTAWVEVLLGNLDWHDEKVFLFSLGMIVPCLLLLAGCIPCTSIKANEKGLTIRTCFFLHFFIPWSDIVGLWNHESFSPTAGRKVQNTVVSIRKGLTPLHRALVFRGAGSLTWSRGFTITSEAQGYRALVRAIEEHVGERSK